MVCTENGNWFTTNGLLLLTTHGEVICVTGTLLFVDTVCTADAANVTASGLLLLIVHGLVPWAQVTARGLFEVMVCEAAGEKATTSGEFEDTAIHVPDGTVLSGVLMT